MKTRFKSLGCSRCLSRSLTHGRRWPQLSGGRWIWRIAASPHSTVILGMIIWIHSKRTERLWASQQACGQCPAPCPLHTPLPDQRGWEIGSAEVPREDLSSPKLWRRGTTSAVRSDRSASQIASSAHLPHPPRPQALVAAIPGDEGCAMTKRGALLACLHNCAALLRSNLGDLLTSYHYKSSWDIR